MQVQDSQHGRAVTQHSSHTAPQSYSPLSHGCRATPPGEPHGPPREELCVEVVEVHPADLEASQQEGGEQSGAPGPPGSTPTRENMLYSNSSPAAPRWNHCRQTKQARLDLPGRGRKNAINTPTAWLTNK